MILCPEPSIQPVSLHIRGCWCQKCLKPESKPEADISAIPGTHIAMLLFHLQTGFCCRALTAVNLVFSTKKKVSRCFLFFGFFFWVGSTVPGSAKVWAQRKGGGLLPVDLRFILVWAIFSSQLLQPNTYAVAEPLQMIYVQKYFCRRQHGGSGVSTATSQQEEFKFKSLWSLHVLRPGGKRSPFNYRSRPPEGNNTLFTTKVNKFS